MYTECIGWVWIISFIACDPLAVPLSLRMWEGRGADSRLFNMGEGLRINFDNEFETYDDSGVGIKSQLEMLSWAFKPTLDNERGRLAWSVPQQADERRVEVRSVAWYYHLVSLMFECKIHHKFAVYVHIDCWWWYSACRSLTWETENL